MSITFPIRALMKASTPAKSRFRPTWQPARMIKAQHLAWQTSSVQKYLPRLFSTCFACLDQDLLKTANLKAPIKDVAHHHSGLVNQAQVLLQAHQVVLATLSEEHVGLDDQPRALQPWVAIEQVHKVGVSPHLQAPQAFQH